MTHYRTVVTQEKENARWPAWAPSIWLMPVDQAEEVRTPSGYENWIGGNGQVYRMNFGSEDDGRPISCTHQTPFMSPDPHLVWLFDWLDLETEVTGDFDVTVKAFMGTGLVSDGTALSDEQGTAAVLGAFLLGTSLLGKPAYRHQRLKLPKKVVRYCSLELSFRGRGHLDLYRLTTWAAPIGRWRVTQ
jgi:hypothetical protein